MEKLNANIIFVDDDIKFKDDPIIEETKEVFERVDFFENSNDAMGYIQANLNSKLIVVLDLAFTSNMPDGHETLEKIRELTYLVPVIIWSGCEEEKEKFVDLIKNRAFAYIKKSASINDLMDTIMGAYNNMNSDINYAIEEWIKVHPHDAMNKPFFTSSDDNTYTLSDILKEIRLQTPFGIDISQKINKLTIDLLMRNKETLK